MEIDNIQKAIKELDLKENIDLENNIPPCKNNSELLQSYFKSGTSRTDNFINIDGLSSEGHYFYVTKSNKYVVDLIIHNYENAYNLVKGCEVRKGIFKRKCYFKSLNIDKNFK